jgi:uncharacterized protein
MNVHFPGTVTPSVPSKPRVRPNPKRFAAATLTLAAVFTSVAATGAISSASASTKSASAKPVAGKAVSSQASPSAAAPRSSSSPTQSRVTAVQQFTAAAKSQIGRTTLYDPAYTSLAYPGGDVPIERGVCTDVVIRAYRAIGIDLQVLVHVDMQKSFSSYPRTGLSRPDANIDHRRVKNLSMFFTRQGAAVPMTQNPADYLPGDVVMWDVSGLAHTGLVVDDLVPGTNRHLVVHNIGDGAQMEDIVFAFPITGHFRYFPV